MRRILIIVYSSFLLILLGNYVYYQNLYNRQINYVVKLLDRQVQIVGLTVDSVNNGFSSDLNRIGYKEDVTGFKEDLSQFFTN